MSDAESAVTCSTHGNVSAAFVCQHLRDHPQQEWFCDYPSEEQPWPDAWCRSCEEAFQAEGEWNERNKSQIEIKLLCHRCYEQSKGSSVPPLLEERADFWRPYVADAISTLQRKQDRLAEAFDFNQHERWDWSQDTGELVLSNGGVPAVTAQFQFVGSLSIISDTWLWSWANRSLVNDHVERMLRVREFGEAHQLANLTVPMWAAEEVDGWEMTATAASVLDSEGAFRSPDENGSTFLVLDNVRWVR